MNISISRECPYIYNLFVLIIYISLTLFLTLFLTDSICFTYVLSQSLTLSYSLPNRDYAVRTERERSHSPKNNRKTQIIVFHSFSLVFFLLPLYLCLLHEISSMSFNFFPHLSLFLYWSLSLRILVLFSLSVLFSLGLSFSSTVSAKLSESTYFSAFSPLCFHLSLHQPLSTSPSTSPSTSSSFCLPIVCIYPSLLRYLLHCLPLHFNWSFLSVSLLKTKVHPQIVRNAKLVAHIRF